MREFRGHHFLPELFSGSPFIVDLGAHQGEFSALMRKYFGASGISLEAHPELAASIPPVEGFKVVNAAASGKDGALQFSIDRANAEGGSVAARVGIGETVEVEAMSFTRLVGDTGREEIDLVKMDIESAELDLIQQTTVGILSKARQWTIEFHDFARPGETDKVLACLERLRSAGFVIFRCCLTGHKDVLAVRRDVLQKSGGLTEAKLHRRSRMLAWRRMILSRILHLPTGVNH